MSILLDKIFPVGNAYLLSKVFICMKYTYHLCQNLYYKATLIWSLDLRINLQKIGLAGGNKTKTLDLKKPINSIFGIQVCWFYVGNTCFC